MAVAKAKKVVPLEMLDIILGADADVIKAAYEAKVQIDELIIQREVAYQKIADLEENIDAIAGGNGNYIFPAPPLPVAGINKPIEASRTFAKGTPIKKKEPIKIIEEQDEIIVNNEEPDNLFNNESSLNSEEI